MDFLPNMVPEAEFNKLSDILAVLVEKLGGEVTISEEEIEDCPALDIMRLFETDELKMRTTRKEQ
jgi:hypothetical protein